MTRIFTRGAPVLAGALVTTTLLYCGVPERDNPLDPAPQAAGADVPALVLEVPLPKALTGAVHRVVATLEAPDMSPITRELTVSPLGPAYGTFSVLAPGYNRSLTLSGYDVAGNLIFTGEQTGITITAHQTARIEVTLKLVSPPPAETPSDSAAAQVQPG